MSRPEQFFHGTRFDIDHTVLPVGEAPHRNYFGDDNPEGKAFATTDERIAWQYADGGLNQSVREPRERVYEVHPHPDAEKGQWNHSRPGASGVGRDMKEWQAPSWKIKRRIDIKPGHQGTFPQLNWHQFKAVPQEPTHTGDVNHPTSIEVEYGHHGPPFEKWDGTHHAELPGQLKLPLGRGGKQ